MTLCSGKDQATSAGDDFCGDWQGGTNGCEKGCREDEAVPAGVGNGGGGSDYFPGIGEAKATGCPDRRVRKPATLEVWRAPTASPLPAT
jgi:hypothetical protein